jgi:hypothetical protein
MFFPGSRYEHMGTYTVTRADGIMVTVTRLPPPRTDPLIGYHRRALGQRLDLIASHHLADATTFWRLCDVNDAMVPDALGAHDLVGIPRKGR